MALIRNTINLCSKHNSLMYVSVRNHWNKDYKPAPFPKTPEERFAAIEKYQVMPSQYKPFEDDGRGCGDYPNLPVVSGDTRDNFYPWDHPETKRNYGELIQAEEYLYAEHRYDINFRPRVPVRMQLLQTVGVLTCLFVIYTAFEKVRFYHSLAEKQYPKPGVTHYTFEIEC